MLPDRLYELVRSALLKNEITKFIQIVDEYGLTKSNVARAMRVNYNRFKRCIETPWEFTQAEIILLSDVFEVDPSAFQKLIEKQYRKAGEHYQIPAKEKKRKSR